MPAQRQFSLAFLLFISAELASCDFRKTENLYRFLMDHYDKNLCPANGKPVDTKISLRITSFNNNNFRQLGVNVFVEMEWKDFRLTWNKVRNNITELMINTDLMWIPDISQYEGLKNPVIDFPKSTALVKDDGSVLVVFPATLTVSCEENLSGFMYKSYSCPLTLGSWAYSSSYVKVTPKSNKVNIKHFQKSSSVYEMTSTNTKEGKVHYPSFTDSYSSIEYKLHIRRPAA